MTNQDILVYPTDKLNKLHAFQGYEPFAEGFRLHDILNPGQVETGAVFLDRHTAEGDETFKQLIPYLILVSEGSVLTYVRARSGGEERLHDLLSVGIGGHVERSDDEDPYWAYAKGAKRELFEEVGLDLDFNDLNASLAGLVNDNSTQVGRVHLGIVHLISVQPEWTQIIMDNCETHLAHPRWIPLDEFDANKDGLMDRLEPWSKYVMNWMLGRRVAEKRWEDTDFRQRMAILAIAANNVSSSAVNYMMSDEQETHEDGKTDLERNIGRFIACMADSSSSRDIELEKAKKASGWVPSQELPTQPS